MLKHLFSRSEFNCLTLFLFISGKLHCSFKIITELGTSGELGAGSVLYKKSPKVREKELQCKDVSVLCYQDCEIKRILLVRGILSIRLSMIYTGGVYFIYLY